MLEHNMTVIQPFQCIADLIKMESVYKSTIFGLNPTVKSVLIFSILKSPHAENLRFSNTNSPHST